MTKRLIASYNGLQEYQHIDPMKPDDLIVETVQDCGPVLEQAKFLREQPVGKEWRHVACIPMCFLDEAAKQGKLHDDNYWRDWLNDPNHKYFRTWPGRIGKGGQW